MKTNNQLKNRIPHLRFVIISDCNFHCSYCRSGGEGILTSDVMSYDDMITMASAASKAGFKHIKITGGEPLLYQKKKGDLFKFIKYLADNKLFEDIQMATNGFYVEQYAKEITESGLSSLTISLDASNSKVFKDITGVDCFNKVIAGLDSMHKLGFPVTINTVIFKKNEAEIPGLIKIAKKFGTRLKILDYMDICEEKKFWKENYIPLDNIEKYLETQCESDTMIYPPGGLGTPMRLFNLPGSVSVFIKDARVGTNYDESCKSCKNYPCQDALISLRITPNASLKPCLMRDDNAVSVTKYLKDNNVDAIEKEIKKMFNLLVSAKYYQHAWKPPKN